MTPTCMYDLIFLLIVLDFVSAVDISRRFDNCDENVDCVRKCCGSGQIYRKKCLPSNYSEPFSVHVYRNKYNYIGSINNSTKFFIKEMSCKAFRLKPNNPTDAYFLQEDGTLWVPTFKRFYSNDYYCLDELDNLSAFICFTSENLAEPLNTTRETNSIGMIISMPFLLVTFLVYLILPEKNLHRKALMSYVFSLLAAYISLVTVQLNTNQISNVSCHILGYSIIFFFLVSFFWMNVMCIDMWLAFSGMRTVMSKKYAERKRFIIYCIYAWGTPIIHLGIVLALNTYAPKNASYYPNLGDSKCFLQNGIATFYYFYLPMAIVIGINIVLFILTTVRINKVKKETSMLKQTESKKSYEDDKQQYSLYVKLMFAMGINWIMEIVSWSVDQLVQDTPQFVWYLTDFTNAVYGLFIFVIFVFKKKIWQSLKKRYYVFIGKPHLAHSMTTSSARGTRASNYSTTDTAVSTDYRLTDMKKIPEESALNRT